MLSTNGTGVFVLAVCVCACTVHLSALCAPHLS